MSREKTLLVRGVFDGIKVVEYGHFLLVPAATAILADWGADVVKIENWQKKYNHVSPHSSLRYRAPDPEATQP